MSRIGRKPINLPSGVTILEENRSINVTGPKGSLQETLLPNLALKINDGSVELTKEIESPVTQSSFGLMRTLIANMVDGVSKGYERQLEINGVGFRAAVNGKAITLNLGFSHPIVFPLPDGIDGKVEKNVLTISGFDKQLVGQVAANIRALKKPEPYKGKGIKYIEERIRRKAGKTATKG
ncbi:MAG: 50S ribosomal protein L6 [Candidatus Saccharimonadia bacterium]